MKKKIKSEEKQSIEETKQKESKPSKDEILKTDEKPKKKRKILGRKIYLHSEENDIKYQGPISYRYMKILAWLFLGLAQLAIIFRIGAKLITEQEPLYTQLASIFNLFSTLPLIYFLLSNIAIILQSRFNAKKRLLIYGLGSIGIYIGINFLVFNFGATLFMKAGDSFLDAMDSAYSTLQMMGFQAYSINVFIDLFLFTLVFFFLSYIPKNHFKGKNLIYFRLFAILPILYEVVALVFKSLDAALILTIPFYVKTIFPTKPPLLFIAVMILALFMKLRERRFLKHGRTLEEYDAFLLSRRNSLQFSLITMIVLFATFAVDFITTSIVVGNMSSASPEDITMGSYQMLSILNSMGLGNCFGILFALPILPLFSYTKTHKNTEIDKFIPIGGIVYVFILIVEVVFFMLLNFLG